MFSCTCKQLKMMLCNALIFLLFATPIHSWTTSAYMDLIWPPRWETDIGDAYLIKHGERQAGYANSLGSCLNKEVPHNVTRTPFPITGGFLRFAFVNMSDTWTGHKFSIDMYFSNEPRNSNDAFISGGVKRMRWWEGFANGSTCAIPMNMLDRVKDPSNATAVASLKGLNVTFALQVHDFENYYTVFEQVDQCAYVTLVSEDKVGEDTNQKDDQEVCDRVNLDYFKSASTSAALPTATASHEDGSAMLAINIYAAYIAVFITASLLL